MNYKENTLSNVLVDTSSSLNVLPKSTLARLSYQGAPMRPWIHEAGAVTSTLHQKLKFVKNDKLVIVGGEKALLISHLSSFTYVDAEEQVGTSGGFIHKDDQHSTAIIEDNDEEEACANFVTHGQTLNNWVVVDVPVVMHRSKAYLKSKSLSRLLEHEEKAIQPFEEHIELVNLSFNDDVNEVKIGSQLCPETKKGLLDLLREYSDVFAWSYQDIPGLDYEIVEHRFLLKPECTSVKQKLRRTHPDMAVKIKEEVEKGIKVDPAKVKAIQEMQAPKTEKKVRGFLGRLNYISRFISHMTSTCAPISKLLWKDQSCDWTEDFQKAFDSIKEYLLEPLILSPPVEGRPLIKYLKLLEESMGCVLGHQDESVKKEYAIYHLSKKFTDCETQYSMLEKTCYALA
ncbi:hypothetical protein KIW84_035296 [Lathyrus oleraceus]|uniref:Reverse transcriptase/retrotransposon-derived protein RNase H-like domain-containing protein n=1 Tax=Pisum sativum TaxID=3888 RepID=A0A9D5B284_PEA|nr:hypothetical protein KIW84_035296 [Pisum sativum]